MSQSYLEHLVHCKHNLIELNWYLLCRLISNSQYYFAYLPRYSTKVINIDLTDLSDRKAASTVKELNQVINYVADKK